MAIASNCTRQSYRPWCGTPSGFTLVEMVITVAVLGIVLAIAVPSMSAMLRSQRISTASSDVYASLIFARSEAIKRNASVRVCTSGDWAAGWSINATDCSGTILRQQNALVGVKILQKDGSTAIGDLTFQRDGRVTTATPAGGIVVKSAEDSTLKARCVVVDVGGRPNIKTDADNDATNGC